MAEHIVVVWQGLAAAAEELTARIKSVQGAHVTGLGSEQPNNYVLLQPTVTVCGLADPQAVQFVEGSIQELQWWWQRVCAEAADNQGVEPCSASTLQQGGEEVRE